MIDPLRRRIVDHALRDFRLGGAALGQVLHGADHPGGAAAVVAQHEAAVQDGGIGPVRPAEAVFLGPAGPRSVDDGMDGLVDPVAVVGMDVVDPPRARRRDRVEDVADDSVLDNDSSVQIDNDDSDDDYYR